MGLFGKGKKSQDESFEESSDFSMDDDVSDDTDLVDNSAAGDDSYQSSDFDGDLDSADSSEDDMDDSEEFSTPQKKKSSLGLIVVLLAVLGGGGFYGYTMMGNKAASPSSLSENALPEKTASIQLPEKVDTPNAEDPSTFVKPIEEAPPQPTGFLNNPNELETIEQKSEEALNQAGTLVPMEGETATAATNKDSLTPMPDGGQNGGIVPNVSGSPSTRLPTAGDITIGKDPADETAAPPQETTEAATPDESKQKVDEMEGTINELTSRVHELEAKVSEQKALLAQKEQSTATQGEKSKKRKKSAPTQPTTPSVTWELRSAQEGRAFISKQGESEMLSVSVGDTVQSIGRVQTITLDSASGMWVVQGTTGKIVQ